MRIERHDDKFLITLTREEAEDIYADIRAGWVCDGRDMVQDVTHNGWVGAVELADEDLLDDTLQNWDNWHCGLEDLADCDEDLALVRSILTDADAPYDRPSSVTVVIEPWTPDYYQRAGIEARKRYREILEQLRDQYRAEET